MDFKDFIDKIDTLQNANLGGLEAQFKLAPKLRLKYNAEKIKANNPKKAAVLALFYPKNDNNTYILLTQRATYKGTHSAQISFPGGKTEKNDNNLEHTAIRETFEEVGIVANKIKIIRELTDVYIPPSNFLATPFLGYLIEEPQLKLNHEVAKIIEISVANLLNDNNIVSVKLNTSYMKNGNVPAFKIDNHIIWGATGMMLSEIKDLLLWNYS